MHINCGSEVWALSMGRFNGKYCQIYMPVSFIKHSIFFSNSFK